MAGSFTEDEVLLPGDPVERFLNPFDERVAIGGLQILPGEVRLHRDRVHVHQWTVQAVDPVYQDDVFIDLLLLDLHETLPHRLDVADARVGVLQQRKQAQRGGGLAVVLPRGRDEYPGSSVVHDRSSTGRLLPASPYSSP